MAAIFGKAISQSAPVTPRNLSEVEILNVSGFLFNFSLPHNSQTSDNRRDPAAIFHSLYLQIHVIYIFIWLDRQNQVIVAALHHVLRTKREKKGKKRKVLKISKKGKILTLIRKAQISTILPQLWASRTILHRGWQSSKEKWV